MKQWLVSEVRSKEFLSYYRRNNWTFPCWWECSSGEETLVWRAKEKLWQVSSWVSRARWSIMYKARKQRYLKVQNISTSGQERSHIHSELLNSASCWRFGHVDRILKDEWKFTLWRNLGKNILGKRDTMWKDMETWMNIMFWRKYNLWTV